MGSSERICACMYMSVTIFQICLHMCKNMSWYLIPTTLSTLGYFLVFAPSISVDAFSSVFVYSPIARPIGSMYPILSTQSMPCALPDPFAATTVSCILVDMPLHGYSSTLCHGVLTFMDDWYFILFNFLLCRNLPYTAGDLISLFPTTSCQDCSQSQWQWKLLLPISEFCLSIEHVVLEPAVSVTSGNLLDIWKVGSPQT